MQAKFLQLRKELQSVIFERGDEITGLLLALVARKNIFIVGPKGTSKSLMIRLCANAIDGAKFWERLFTKFTVPEEVFGPVKISALKNDSFERKIEGHLPDAHFGFADEVFKANSSILNSLLKIINEREFDMDGKPIRVPLEVFIGASNEIPTDESLAAIYDRFLLRFKVSEIAETANFITMLKGPKVYDEFATGMTVRMTLDEVHQAQVEAKQVVMPDPIIEAIAMIRSTLSQQGLMPSSRRWNEAVEVIKAKAWLQGRPEVQMDDLSVLVHILWEDPQHKGLVQGIVLEVANPLLKQAEEYHDAVQIAWSNLTKTVEEKEKVNKAVETLAKVNDAMKRLTKVLAEGQKNGMDMTRVEEFIRVDREIQQHIQRDYLQIGA
ncbi:MAG: AAA family ATPase [Candidatus Bathyarchaeia archaeon]